MMATAIQGIRAKLKPIEELPDWVFCCPDKKPRAEEILDDIVTVLPSSAQHRNVICDFCGQNTSITIMFLADKPNHFIPVDCYDFDEGIESAAHMQGGE